MKVFLFVLIAGSGSGGGRYHYERHEFPDLKTCNASVAAAKVDNASATENETAVVLFCGTENESRNAKGEWKK